jgi:TatD DNase family protein
MRLFDSHCHLQDRAFEGDWAEAIERALDAGVSGMLLCGYDTEANGRTLEMAARFPSAVYAAVGFHPHDAKDVTPGMLNELSDLARRDEVVAIGELGLDFYRDHSPHDTQRAVLEAQLAIALATGKPVSVHSREAEDTIGEQLLPFAERFAALYPGRVPGVMHCFGGTLEQARPYLDAGFLVSISAVVTYPKNDETRSLAAGLPDAQIVVETDSPYLPPQRLRGRRNEPVHLPATVEAVAAARGADVREVAALTTSNIERALGIGAAGRSGELAPAGRAAC